MASVYMRDDSKFWWAAFKSPDGRWVCKSTKTTNKAEATRLAHTFEGAGATLALETPEGAQLDRVVRQMWEQYSGRRLEVQPVRSFFEAWLARMRTTRAANTALRYSKPVGDFLAFLGKRAENDIRSITTKDMQAFIDGEAAAGKSSHTCALNAKVLRAVFNAALRAGAVERNPAGMLEVGEVVSEEREPFSMGEFEALLAASDGTDWHTAVLLGALAGLRIGDAANLKWDAVDFTSRAIRFVPQKTARKKKQLVIPLHPRLFKHLDKLAGTDEAQVSQFLCPSLAGRPVSGRAGISAEFIVEVMGKAGIDTNRTERKGAGHAVAKKSFHSLRHFFVSGMANAGVAADVRRKLAGHGDEKQTARYSHYEMQTLRKAVGTVAPSVAKRKAGARRGGQV